MAAESRILVFTKTPLAGTVKTRLIPLIGAEAAVRLHHALLRRTLETVTRANIAAIELWCAPAPDHPVLSDYASEFPLSLHTQQGTNLGERMGHAAQSTLRTADCVIIVGTDCPGLCEQDLSETLQYLHAGMDAVIGPAEDGGYWLLGLRRGDATLFTDINWGKDTVLSETRDRLRTLGWRWQELNTRWDVDRPEDIERLRIEHPDLSFDIKA